MNNSDWIQLTGSSFAGRGRAGRPVNLQRLIELAGKAARPAGTRHGAADRQAAAGRRLRYEVARLTAPDVTSVQHGRAYRRARYAAAVAAQPVTTIRVSDYGKGYAFATERARAQRLAALRRHW